MNHTGRHRSPGKDRGFTLIELMVTVVVAAILVTVAAAAYSSFVLKAHRTDAKSALLNIAALEERYFSTQGCYSSTPTDVGYTGAAGSWTSTQGITVGNGYYQVFFTSPSLCGAVATNGTSATIASFTISAAPVPGSQQAHDTACALYTVTSAGLRTATTSGGADNTQACWN